MMAEAVVEADVCAEVNVKAMESTVVRWLFFDVGVFVKFTISLNQSFVVGSGSNLFKPQQQK